MEKKAKHSKLFYQYLLSYVFILLLPLIVLSVFIYSYVLNMLQEEIYDNNMNALMKVQDTVEAQLRNITSLEHKVYLSKTLKSFFLTDDGLTAIAIKNELEKYRQMNYFLADIAYYQEDDNYIMAASSSCRKEEFWNLMYDFENWEYKDFLRELKENGNFFFKEAQPVIVKQGNARRIVTLIIPLDTYGRRCVIMLLDEALFTNLMPVTDPREEVSAIVDESGRILVSRGNSDLISSVYGGAEADRDATEVTVQGKRYLRSRVYSEDFRWSYESLIPLRDIREKVVYVNWMMALICLFVCTGGALGIIYFMRRNYIPIQTLEIASNEILSNEDNRNEIDHVKTVLEYLTRQNRKLNAEEENRKSALKERFLSKWLSGWYEDERQILEQAARAGFPLNRETYQVGVLRIRKKIAGLEQNMENILTRSAPDSVEISVRVQAEVRQALIVAGYDADRRKEAESYLEGCLDTAEGDWGGLKGCLALGRPVRERTKVKDSYAEALKASEYDIIMEDRRVIRYEETVSWVGNGMPDIQPKRLEYFIRNRDPEGLKGFLNASLDEMINRKIDIRQIRMLCTEFIYALEETIAGVNRDYFIDEPLYDNITGILQYDTVREMMEIIGLIGCDITERLNDLGGSALTEDLLKYIAENCYSADFSATSMADEFKMSLSDLSRYFKNRVGKNLSDYVTELKISKAKELLLYKDMPVKDVAEAVGYYSVNSFNRRFKQITGYTPGEWRLEQRKAQ